MVQRRRFFKLFFFFFFFAIISIWELMSPRAWQIRTLGGMVGKIYVGDVAAY